MDGDGLREYGEEPQERKWHTGIEDWEAEGEEILSRHCGLVGNLKISEEHGLPD